MNRRKLIAGAGSAVVFGATTRARAGLPISTACHGTRRLTPGPYLTPESPLRSDIREDVPGVPMRLQLRIVDDIFCQPVKDAVVDVWQCNASGLYSGVPNIEFDRESFRITDRATDMRGKSFLRGHQITGDDGTVAFTSVFPGSYFPRLPHVHVRVQWRDVEWTTLDTQLFFSEEIEREVFATAPYSEHSAGRVDLDGDLVLKGDSRIRDELTVAMSRDGDGFVGRFEIAATAL